MLPPGRQLNCRTPSRCHRELLVVGKNLHTFGDQSVSSEVFCVGSKGDSGESLMARKNGVFPTKVGNSFSTAGPLGNEQGPDELSSPRQL